MFTNNINGLIYSADSVYYSERRIIVYDVRVSRCLQMFYTSIDNIIITPMV